MLTQVHIVIDQREHDAFRARARAEGKSLSEWLREVGVEPDWQQHLAVAVRSRLSGIEPV